MTQTDATESRSFYKDVVERLTQARIPFALCGAFAFAHYTGIHRDTKDLDLMLKRADLSGTSAEVAPVCGGTLVSRQQFLVDILDWGYVDGRLAAGVMSEDEIEAWTRAIGRTS